MENIAEYLSHDELVQATNSSFSALLLSDYLLKDLPDDITIEEIQSQISVEHGQAITIFINRENNKDFLRVIVPQSVTVSSLKKAIAKSFESYQRRAGIRVKISWKYIWKTYSLNYDSIALDNNDSCIQDYGVKNKVVLTFKKKNRK